MDRYDHEATAALLARVPERYTRGPWMQHPDEPKILVAADDDTMSLLSRDADGYGCFFEAADCAIAALAPDLASALALAHSEIARLRRHSEELCGLLQDAGHMRWARDDECRACSAITAYRLDYPAPAQGKE